MEIPKWKRKLSILLSAAERVWGTTSKVLLGATLAAAAAALPAAGDAQSTPAVDPKPRPSISAFKKFSQKFVLRQGSNSTTLRLIAQHQSHSSHSSHHSHKSHSSHQSHRSGGWV